MIIQKKKNNIKNLPFFRLPIKIFTKRGFACLINSTCCPLSAPITVSSIGIAMIMSKNYWHFRYFDSQIFQFSNIHIKFWQIFAANSNYFNPKVFVIKHALYFIIYLSQPWATWGPRAACGPSKASKIWPFHRKNNNILRKSL